MDNRGKTVQIGAGKSFAMADKQQFCHSFPPKLFLPLKRCVNPNVLQKSLSLRFMKSIRVFLWNTRLQPSRLFLRGDFYEKGWLHSHFNTNPALCIAWYVRNHRTGEVVFLAAAISGGRPVFSFDPGRLRYLAGERVSGRPAVSGSKVWRETKLFDNLQFLTII